MGTGDVALQDKAVEGAEHHDNEKAADDSTDASSYGALDIKETTEEETKQQDKDWHKPPKQKKKKPKKKHVRVSESIHEILVNRPHRPFCLHFFIFVEIIAILASLNLLITEIIPIIIAPPSKIGYLPFALR